MLHKGGEVWLHIELIEVKKDKYMSGYKMDGDSICNSGGHIPSAIGMVWGMISMEGDISEVAE